jgi:hypothetical protein
VGDTVYFWTLNEGILQGETHDGNSIVESNGAKHFLEPAFVFATTQEAHDSFMPSHGNGHLDMEQNKNPEISISAFEVPIPKSPGNLGQEDGAQHNVSASCAAALPNITGKTSSANPQTAKLGSKSFFPSQFGANFTLEGLSSNSAHGSTQTITTTTQQLVDTAWSAYNPNIIGQDPHALIAQPRDERRQTNNKLFGVTVEPSVSDNKGGPQGAQPPLPHYNYVRRETDNQVQRKGDQPHVTDDRHEGNSSGHDLVTATASGVPMEGHQPHVTDDRHEGNSSGHDSVTTTTSRGLMEKHQLYVTDDRHEVKPSGHDSVTTTLKVPVGKLNSLTDDRARKLIVNLWLTWGKPLEDEFVQTLRKAGVKDTVLVHANHAARLRFEEGGVTPDGKQQAPSDDEAFVVDTWEEEEHFETATTLHRSSITGHAKPPPPSHSMTSIPGKEGMVVDTGAWENLSGGDSIRRQEAAALQAGHATRWQRRARPKHVSGVGDNAKVCLEDAVVPGCLNDGTLIKYTTPVISGDPSTTPTLYGLKDMEAENTYFATRKGVLAMIPEGTDDQIIWPQGTRFVQLERAPSNHWILTTSNWDKAKPNPRL